MNKKITFPELIEAVAAITGVSKRTSETFLKELVAVVSDSLANGENVRIKNFGMFKLVEVGERKSVNINTGAEMQIPGHTKVVFTLDRVLADAINTPFANFEAVEISEKITEEELNVMTSTEPVDNRQDGAKDAISDEDEGNACTDGDSATESAANVQTDLSADGLNEKELVESGGDELVTVQTEEQKSEENENIAVSKAANVENQTITSDHNGNDSDNIETEDSTSENATDADISPNANDERSHGNENTNKRTLFFRGYFWGAVTMLLIACVAFYIYNLYGNKPYYEIGSTTWQSADLRETSVGKFVDDTMDVAGKVMSHAGLNEADTFTPGGEALHTHVQEPTVKYDTISRSRYLTTMSRAYYGDFRFWVYIYEENKEKIDDPNAIPPGTVVVIPPASKYGIDKDDYESVAKARELAVEILKSHK